MLMLSMLKNMLKKTMYSNYLLCVSNGLLLTSLFGKNDTRQAKSVIFILVSQEKQVPKVKKQAN